MPQPDAAQFNRRIVLLGAGSLLALSACGKAAAPDQPLVATTYGEVRGTQEDGVNIFKGVRYGAPTERFKPPQPPQPWTEPVDATAYGASSPQVEGGGAGLFSSWRNPTPQSEDCLFLNVWTGGLGDGRKRPVMVWFHGGGFVTGSGSSHAYDGARLVKRGDVVIVTVNHRLNVFGYTYLPDAGEAYADAGAVGTLDMIQSLKWVRDNIAAFGGDPANVTIFGESGGGSKVSTMTAMPLAKGLFHKAIVQSGSALIVRSQEEARATTDRLFKALGLQPGDVAALEKLPVETLIAAVKANAAVTGFPVVDGRNLPRDPWAPEAPETARDVPMIIGTNTDETTTLNGARNPKLFDLTWETLPAELDVLMEPREMDTAGVIAEYRRVYPQITPPEVYFQATSNVRFGRNAILQAERKARAGGAPAFKYLVDWDTPVDGGKYGAAHGMEIGFVFDNVAKSESFYGKDGMAEAQQLADQMSTAWIAFAKTGDPGWPAYNLETRPTMVFDVQSQVVNDPRSEERKMFEPAIDTRRVTGSA